MKFRFLLYRGANSDFFKKAHLKNTDERFNNILKNDLYMQIILPLNILKLSHYYLTQNYSRHMHGYS